MNLQEHDQFTSSMPVNNVGSSDPAEAESPLSKNTSDCVCTVDMGDPSNLAGSSDHVEAPTAEPWKKTFCISMTASFAGSALFQAFNPSNTFASNHKQAQIVWINSWCGVALTEWLSTSVLALCFSLYLRRTSRVIGLLVAMCSLSGAVLGLVVMRFSTDEQHSRLKALLLVDLRIAGMVSASMIGTGCSFLAAWRLDVARFHAEAICEDMSRWRVLRFVFAIHLVCSVFVAWTVYIAIGILEQAQ